MSKQYNPILDAEPPPKSSLYQPLPSFHVDLLPHFINLPLVLDILLNNIIPVILPVIQNTDILSQLHASVYIFLSLSLHCSKK